VVVNRSVFPKYITRTELSEANGLAALGVNRDAGSTRGDEKYIIRSVEMMHDEVSRFVATPGTASLNTL